MNTPAANHRLDTLLALNEQIVALGEAGVTVDLGIGAARLGPTLSRLSDALARQVGLGESLEAAVVSESAQAPAEYQKLVLEWLGGGDLPTLLQNRLVSASRAARTRRVLNAGLVYPLIVALLACLGLAGFCWFLLPAIESSYESLRQPVGSGILWLRAARDTLPLWAVGLPLLVALLAWWRVRGDSRPGFARPGRAAAAATRNRLARSSEALADLLDTGVEPAAAVRLATDASQNTPAATKRFPLFAWAATSTTTEGDKPTAEEAEDLRAVAAVYDDLADRRGRRIEVLAPILACVLIGGGATLLYALALFVPVIELLWTLSF